MNFEEWFRDKYGNPYESESKNLMHAYMREGWEARKQEEYKTHYKISAILKKPENEQKPSA